MLLKRALYRCVPAGIGCALMLLKEQHMALQGSGYASDQSKAAHHPLHTPQPYLSLSLHLPDSSHYLFHSAMTKFPVLKARLG